MNIYVRPEPYHHPNPIADESLNWNRRTDEYIDEMVTLLGLKPIPYRSSPEATHRYLSVYRLRLLKDAVYHSV